MDTWVVSTFRLLWIMFLWTLVCWYLFKSLPSNRLNRYIGVELLDVSPSEKLLYAAAAPLYIPTNDAKASDFPTSSLTFVISLSKNCSHPFPHTLLATIAQFPNLLLAKWMRSTLTAWNQSGPMSPEDMAAGRTVGYLNNIRAFQQEREGGVDYREAMINVCNGEALKLSVPRPQIWIHLDSVGLQWVPNISRI